jgi:hypothetical protein
MKKKTLRKSKKRKTKKPYLLLCKKGGHNLRLALPSDFLKQKPRDKKIQRQTS